MLAYTGLETVANLAEETREPGKALPRSLFSAIGLVVIVDGADRDHRRRRAIPAGRLDSALGDEWQRAPLVGIAEAFHGHVAGRLVDTLRVLVGLSGGLILFAAATTSMSGCTRLLHSMGGHEQLPRAFGRLDRRSLVAREAIVATAASRSRIVIAADTLGGRRGDVPRERVLVRRAARVHRRAGGGHPAAGAEPDLARPVPRPSGGSLARACCCRCRP